MYEIEERYCKSELVIVGWRSQEMAYQMDKKMKPGHGPSKEAYENENLPTGLPERFFNTDGELDLRQVTGAEALKFLRAQGINVPFIPPRQ